MAFMRNSLQDQSEIYYERASLYEEFSRAEDAERKVADFLLPRVEGRDVLDLGCGSGKYVELFAPFARHITGVDAAEAQLSIARSKASGFGNVALIHGDALDAPLPKARYDVAIACWTIGTIADEAKRLAVIERVERLLAPGGGFYLVENDSSGAFEDLRGKNAVSAAYHQWLRHEAGFDLVGKISTRFEFSALGEAVRIMGAIWGAEVGSRTLLHGQGSIEHCILVWSKTARETFANHLDPR